MLPGAARPQWGSSSASGQYCAVALHCMRLHYCSSILNFLGQSWKLARPVLLVDVCASFCSMRLYHRQLLQTHRSVSSASTRTLGSIHMYCHPPWTLMLAQIRDEDRDDQSRHFIARKEEAGQYSSDCPAEQEPICIRTLNARSESRINGPWTMSHQLVSTWSIPCALCQVASG